MCSEALQIAVDPRDHRRRGTHRIEHGPGGILSNKPRRTTNINYSKPVAPAAAETNCFGVESVVLLALLAVSLVTLPLVLPPLPPPPLTLLLIPIAIFGVLMILALMPRNGADFGYL